MEDSCTEPRTDSLALISSSQVAEQAVEDPNDAPDPLTFVLQKLSPTSSKPQRAMVLRDILIHVGGFGHCRNAHIKVGQEFMEAENSWTDLGLMKEELFEDKSSNNNTSRTSAWSISTTTASPTSLKTELYSGKHHEEACQFFLADTRLPCSLR